MIAAIRRNAALIAAGSWSTQVHAQGLGGGGGTDISIVRVLAALAICVAAAFALALVVRMRKGAPASGRSGRIARAISGSRRIEVVEARRASPFADLCLVRCDGVEYLLLCGPANLQVLRQTQAGEGAGGGGSAT